MRCICVVIMVSCLCSGAAAAQEPPPLPMTMTGQVDIAASTLGLMPTVPAAPTASISTGCSNQPITHDSAIWSVLVYGTSVPPGGVLASPGTSVYTVPSQPGHVYVPVVESADIPPIRIQLRDKTFTSAVTTNFGLLVMTFGPMTLSEAGDFVNALETSDAVDAAFRAARISLQVLDFVDPKAPGRRPDQFYEQELLMRLGPQPLPGDFAQKLAALKPAAFRADVTLAVNRGSVPAAKNAIRIMTGAAPPRADAGQYPIFIIDEPCLAFSVSPVPVAGDRASTAVSFRGRYDFYDGMGTRFAKLRAEGDAAPSGTYYDRVEGTLDIGANRAAGRSVVGFSGSGGYSVTRQSGAKQDAWRAVVKTQLQGPNLAGIFGSLPGATTSPILSVEFGGAGGTSLTDAEADWILRGTFALTGRLTTRLYVDLRGVGAAGGEPRFAGADHYGYGSLQVRFNVNKDWDYLVKYECGKKDPDYRHFCGGQSGLALTLGR